MPQTAGMTRIVTVGPWCILAVLALSVPGIFSAKLRSWSTTSAFNGDPPRLRLDSSMAELGGFLYVFGGFSGVSRSEAALCLVMCVFHRLD